MDRQQTLDTISQLFTDLDDNKKLIDKLTEENRILKSKLNKISNLITSNKLLIVCDHETIVKKIFVNRNYDELLKYTNFNLKYVDQQIFDFINSNNISAIKHYIDHCEDLEYAANDGWRLIHYFCRRSNHESTLYLINKGVKLDVKTIYGSNPIKLACESGSFDVIQLIMSKGIKLNASHRTYIKHNINLTYEEKKILINTI